MLLGITVGSAFVAKPELEVILGTMLSSSFAIGISTGVSVYEAEIMEREKRTIEMERALLTDLKDTEIAKLIKTTAIIISLINFITPLIACAISITPFILAYLGFIEVQKAAWISIAATISTLFSAGVYIGRNGKGNAILKGIKMVAFGTIAFLIGYCIEILL